jgi:TctA family transporter
MIITVCLVGSYVDGNEIENVFLAVGFGFLGYMMKRNGYSRAPLIIGIVLGTIIERYLHMSIKLYGWLFFMRPICMVMIVIIILTIAGPVFFRRHKKISG